MPRKTKKNAVKAMVLSQTLTTDIGTQTEADEGSIEVLRLQAQIESLQNELDEYKKQFDAFKKKDCLEVLKTPKRTPRSESKIVNSLENKTVVGSGSKLKKGCTCKGSCSNSKCGCVKKGGFCEEFCKCSTSKCCNQDVNKENVNGSVLSNEELKTLGNLENLTISPKISHGSATNTKKVISNASEDVQKILKTEKNRLANISTSRLRKQLYAQKADELVDVIGTEKSVSLSSSEKDHSPSLKLTRSATRKNLKKSENKSNSNHKNQDFNNTSVPQELFKSDEDSILASPHQFVAKRRYNTRKSPPKISVSTESNSSGSKSNSESERDANLNPMMPKRQLPRSPRDSNISEVNENGESKLNSDSDKDVFLNPMMPKRQLPRSPRDSNISELDVNDDSFNPMIPRRQLPRSPVTSSTGSLSSNSEIDMDSSINPMIPKRQLPRSPIKVGDSTILMQNKRFSPPPMKELAEEVDWEQHQSELLQCKICKRKFWPHRLEKHETHCKGY